MQTILTTCLTVVGLIAKLPVSESTKAIGSGCSFAAGSPSREKPLNA